MVAVGVAVFEQLAGRGGLGDAAVDEHGAVHGGIDPRAHHYWSGAGAFSVVGGAVFGDLGGGVWDFCAAFWAGAVDRVEGILQACLENEQ